MIKKEEAFVTAVIKAFQKAEKDEVIVTLGIEPTRPDTGYGYINYDDERGEEDIYPVLSFKEKPTKEIAQKYIDTGGYVWNAGIFIWSCKTIIIISGSLLHKY